MLTLLRPEFLAFGLLAIVIALAYLRIIPTPKQVVGSLDLWQIALARRPWWYGLQRPLSLALLLAIIALLTLAVAEPVALAPKAEPRRFVLVIDTSASMSAFAGSKSSFEQAREEAAKWIESVASHDRMMIVSAGSGVQVHCDWTSDPAKLRSALASIHTTDGVDSMSDVVAMFHSPLASSDELRPQVIIFTDGVCPDFAAIQQQAQRENIALVVQSSAAANAGIVRLAARPAPDDDSSYDILAEVVASENWQGELAMPFALGDTKGPEEKLQFGAEKSIRKLVRIAAPKGGLLSVKLAPAIGMAADDTATARLAPRQSAPVYLLGKVHPSIREALIKLPGTRVEAVETLPKPLPSESVVVVQGEVPASLPAAHLFVIGPGSDSESWKVGESLEPPPAVQMLGRAPFGESVDLADIVVERAQGLQLLGTDLRVVAAAGETPILAIREGAARRLVLLNLDMEKTDLALRPGWTPLVRNIVSWLGGRTEATVTCQSISAPFQFAPSDGERTLTGPDGIARKIPIQATKSPPAERVGEWKLSGGSSDEIFHVMLGLPGESQLAGPAAIEKLAPPAKLEAARDFHFAPWLILAAGLLVVLEWGLFHQRLTI